MYNVMERQTGTQIRYAQVVYLKYVAEKTTREIADIVGYAVSTVRNYCHKYYDLLDYAKSIFEEKVIAHTVRKSKYNNMINANGFDIDTKDGELCYLFEFYNEEGQLLCSKVGTTTRTIRIRLREELASKTYKGMGATKAIVNRVYQCGEYPAEGLESLIRSEYIKKYPKSFKKNDRFIGEYFDFELCDQIANEYLN